MSGAEGDLQVSFGVPYEPGNWWRVFDGESEPCDLNVWLDFTIEGKPLYAGSGPDQTAPGPSPVEVQFDGCNSTGNNLQFQWFNQWGERRQKALATLR
jgi:hypothetical protein